MPVLERACGRSVKRYKNLSISILLDNCQIYFGEHSVGRVRRGRPRGADMRKVLRVIHVLAREPQGLWLREISKRCGIHPTTVSNYANTILSPLLEDVSLGSDEKPILRVLKLKDWVFERLERGEDIRRIISISVMARSAGRREETEIL